MRFLFLSNPYMKNSQNARIVKILSDEIIARGNIVEFVYPVNGYVSKFFNSLNRNVHTFVKIQPSDYYQAQTKIASSKGLAKTVMILRHPFTSFLVLINRLNGNKFFQIITEKWIKKAEKLIRTSSYDFIIAVSNPFSSACVLSKVKFPMERKVWYQLDPQSSSGFIAPENIEQIKRIEEQILSNVGTIFCQISEFDRLSKQLPDIIGKIHILNFPLFCPQPSSSLVLKETNNTMLVYAGALPIKVRNPIEILKYLSQINAGEYEYHLWITNYDEVIDILRNAKINRNVHFHRPVNRTKIKKILEQSSVLINFGNDSEILFPSKLVEYISLRKPILNFYYSRNMSTVKFLENYSAAYSVNIDRVEEINEEKLVTFINESSRQNVEQTFDELLDRYGFLSPKSVASDFLKCLEKNV